MKRIVLITTGQPSTNPRIVKEADTLHSAGFKVTLLYCYIINWAAKADEVLLKNARWEHKMVGGSPFKEKRIYKLTRSRFKMSGILSQFLGNGFLAGERSQARCYDELLKAAKVIKADWYIGHNLGALPVCVNAAKFHKSRSGFDFEDYHREENSDCPLHEKKRIEYLEKKYVPALDYISTSSPLITQKVANNFPNKSENIITLLNCFPLSQQPAFRNRTDNDHELKLFWFSQTIGANRGLEVLIDALIRMNDPAIHLTLAGKCTTDFEAYLDVHAGPIRDRIHLAGIIAPGDLPAFAAQHDVGMALEPVVPENRNICLTNKVFTYILAGNALILTGTAMQKDFNDKFDIGEIFPINDVASLVEKIRLYQSAAHLYNHRRKNYELAQQVKWEKESKKLVDVITGSDKVTII